MTTAMTLYKPKSEQKNEIFKMMMPIFTIAMISIVLNSIQTVQASESEPQSYENEVVVWTVFF